MICGKGLMERARDAAPMEDGLVDLSLEEGKDEG